MTAAAAFRAAAGRPLIVCDVDGVLAFFAEAVATALNARFSSSLLVQRMTTYRVEDTLPRAQGKWLAEQVGRPVFYANLAPDFTAIDALRAIRDGGLHVTIASDRVAGVKDATVEWLNRWEVGYDAAVLDGPGSKQAGLAGHGPGHPAVLLDDNPGKWLTIARPGVRVWSPRRPWTPQDWQRYRNVWVFDSWADVIESLDL